jgi:hypothetical protein
LPKVWKSAELNRLRREYRQCDRCAYLCYVFYSVHAGLGGTVDILRDQWKNARAIINEKQTEQVSNK